MINLPCMAAGRFALERFSSVLIIVTTSVPKEDVIRPGPPEPIVMVQAILEALRRLFPPLEVKPKLLTLTVLLSLYGLFVYLAIEFEHLPRIEWGAASTVVNGLALGFLVGFRNKEAYDRWWEARKLWGQLINENRTLCLKVRSIVGIEQADRDRIGQILIEFAESLKDHLRLGDKPNDTSGANEKPGNWVHRPSLVASELMETVFRWKREGHLDGWGVLWLDAQLKGPMEICGACERIRYTPLSSSYRALLRQGIALYLAIAPFYLMEDIGLAGFPMFVVAAYFLVGIELVAEEIEEPFGPGGDNLPLERYCATIASSVHEILGFSTVSADADRRIDRQFAAPE